MLEHRACVAAMALCLVCTAEHSAVHMPFLCPQLVPTASSRPLARHMSSGNSAGKLLLFELLASPVQGQLEHGQDKKQRLTTATSAGCGAPLGTCDTEAGRALQIYKQTHAPPAAESLSAPSLPSARVGSP